MNDLRLIEKLVNEYWQKISMSEICTGDIFRMFEPDTGEQIGELWRASENARVVDGVAGVVCEHVEGNKNE